MTKEEWFNLPKISLFDNFKNKRFDKEMALGLLGELQEQWCDCCDNYKEGKCGCFLLDFKEEMIRKINEHFDNPPLSFDDLREGMWVWDDEEKWYRNIVFLFAPCKQYPKGSFKAWRDSGETGLDFVVFKENYFYRREVTE